MTTATQALAKKAALTLSPGIILIAIGMALGALEHKHTYYGESSEHKESIKANEKTPIIKQPKFFLYTMDPFGQDIKRGDSIVTAS